MDKKLMFLIVKRVLIEGSKGVAYGAALLAVTSLFKGELRELTTEDYINGKKPKGGK